ncbi:MAG: ATP-binding protein [Planctomycetota bacterium]|jgi:PAS domain S-box-containing protein
MEMLVVIQGAHQGQRYPIGDTRLCFGRDHKVGIRLEDEGISRSHAAVYRHQERIWLEDLGSTNGTYVNNVRIHEPCIIKNNDHISMGQTVIQVQTARDTRAKHVTLSDTRHESESLIKIDLNATSVFEVLKKDESTVFPTDGVTEALLGLHQFNLQISGILDMEELLDVSLPQMVQACHAERGAILLYNSSGDLIPRAQFMRQGSKGNEVQVSRTLVNEVLENGEGLLSAEPEKDDRYRDTHVISLGQTTSMMCVPLLIKDRVLGVVYVDVSLQARPLNETNLRMLSAMGMELCTAIENARLYAMLKDSEEFSSCVLKSIAGGLLVIDVHGKVVRVNEMGAELAGFSAGEVLGTALGELPALSELDILVGQTLHSGRAQERDGLHLRPQGKARVPVAATSAALEDYNGERIGVVVHFRDMTRLHQLAEEVKRGERLSALGQMASGIAHEIRNPLNSVQGFVQLMQESTENQEHQKFCGIVLEEVTRINHIVQDMLDFSRQQPFSLDPMEITPTLRHVLQLTASTAQETGVVLQMESWPQEPLWVQGNSEKLIQVFLNIVNNAIQATPAGGRVTVREGLSGDRGEWVELVVEDTGCGMSQEDRAQIFNPFYTTRDEGTGLGLPICQKIIEQHSGHILVESVLREGSRFIIRLPRSAS